MFGDVVDPSIKMGNKQGTSVLLTILLEARILRATETQTKSAKESADLVERAAVRMNRLIRDLLDVARLEPGALALDQTPVPVASFVTDFVEAQRSQTSLVSLELKLELMPDLGEVFADRDRLLQVMENLFTNAERITKSGGRITVGAVARDGEVVFWITDTGPGIDAEDLLHLFDQSWRVRRAGRGGAGLGLTIVKAIVEAHGGHVWAESRAGVGSTFYFTMPRTGTLATEPRLAAPRPPENQQSTAR